MSEPLSVTVDSWVKEKVQKLAKERGVGVSEVVNEFLSKMILKLEEK